MQKSALGLLFLSMCLVLAGCVEVDTTGDDEMMEEDETMMQDETMMDDEGVELMIEEDAMMIEDDEADDDSAVEDEISMRGDTRIIKIDAANWLFSPGVITAAKGEKVKLQITSSEGIHGFAVPSLSMNVRIEPGKTVTVDLPTDTAGTFDAFCSIPCGSGHKEMKATIVIG